MSTEINPVTRTTPTPTETSSAIARLIGVRGDYRLAAEAAIPAFTRLIKVMAANAGQSYKVRALLFSLWNGKRADLSDVLLLDYNIKIDLCLVIAGFGFEDRKAGTMFFYDYFQEALKQAGGGLFEWFIEEGDRQPT